MNIKNMIIEDDISGFLYQVAAHCEEIHENMEEHLDRNKMPTRNFADISAELRVLSDILEGE